MALPTLTASLRQVATAPQSVACPFAGDRRAAIQAGELNRWSQTTSQGSWGGAGAAIEHVKKAVAILDRVVQRQLQHGHWFVPEDDAKSAFAWRVWNHSQPMPALASAIHRVVTENPAARPINRPSRVFEPATHRRRPTATQSAPAR
jgi:hypothetical protein